MLQSCASLVWSTILSVNHFWRHDYFCKNSVCLALRAESVSGAESVSDAKITSLAQCQSAIYADVSGAKLHKILRKWPQEWSPENKVFAFCHLASNVQLMFIFCYCYNYQDIGLRSFCNVCCHIPHWFHFSVLHSRVRCRPCTLLANLYTTCFEVTLPYWAPHIAFA